MKLVRLVAVAAAVLLGSSVTQAGFKLRFSSGSTTSRDILLGGTSSSGDLGTHYKNLSGGADNDGTKWSYNGYDADVDGISLNSLQAFGYTIRATLVYTNAPHGNPAILTLASLKITRTAAATGDLTISLTSDGYTKPDGDARRGMRTFASGYLSGGSSGSASFTSMYDTANREFGGTDGSVTTRTLYGPTDSDGVLTYLPDGTPVFSISNTITLTGMNTGGQFLTGGMDTLIEPLPAPAGLVLVALGIPALGLLRRFTRKTAADAAVA